MRSRKMMNTKILYFFLNCWDIIVKDKASIFGSIIKLQVWENLYHIKTELASVKAPWGQRLCLPCPLVTVSPAPGTSLMHAPNTLFIMTINSRSWCLFTESARTLYCENANDYFWALYVGSHWWIHSEDSSRSMLSRKHYSEANMKIVKPYSF